MLLLEIEIKNNSLTFTIYKDGQFIKTTNNENEAYVFLGGLEELGGLEKFELKITEKARKELELTKKLITKETIKEAINKVRLTKEVNNKEPKKDGNDNEECESDATPGFG
jgi:hypothetical protein